MTQPTHIKVCLALTLSGLLVAGCSTTPEPKPEPENVAMPEPTPTPEPKAVIVEPEPVVAVVRKTVHFEFDSAQLTQESKTELMQLIEQVTSDGLPNSKIVIAGHADATGPESYNETLSQERARSVENFLKSNLNSNQWTVEGYGETKPVASNDDPKGREQNRRVVVKYVASNKPLAMNQ